MTKAQIHITLIGEDFNTKEVTEALDITPQYIREKEEILNNGRRFGHTEWGISTKIEEIDDLHTFFQQFMSGFKDKFDLMKKVADNSNAQWNLLFELDVTDGCFPSIYFDSESINEISRLNASMGFDVLIL